MRWLTSLWVERQKEKKKTIERNKGKREGEEKERTFKFDMNPIGPSFYFGVTYKKLIQCRDLK
jgi:hypothetical protein